MWQLWFATHWPDISVIWYWFSITDTNSSWQCQFRMQFGCLIWSYIMMLLCCHIAAFIILLVSPNIQLFGSRHSLLPGDMSFEVAALRAIWKSISTLPGTDLVGNKGSKLVSCRSWDLAVQCHTSTKPNPTPAVVNSQICIRIFQNAYLSIVWQN